MSVQDLIDALEQMDQRYEALLEVMLEKKQAIISNEYEGLVRTISKESKMLKGIEEQEKQILASAQAFLQSKGIKSRLELTITELLRLVFDPEEKRALSEIQNKLSDRLSKLKQINTLNQSLIDQSLSFIDFSLNLMVGGMDEEATYAPPQQQERRTSARSSFDTRA
ncbi:flagellar protein FlgN [Paenibacillus ihumii]|uniref:flagellar protein FlgN n=1 Tax=Paenibacillus ihumii TaxID=687436 RepID=UPI0006D78EFC|nr:flagellar protein FlgN [Paenibacillus ihumii]